jgi:hypothetical protein
MPEAQALPSSARRRVVITVGVQRRSRNEDLLEWTRT